MRQASGNWSKEPVGKFCSECGAGTIDACPNCNNRIRGSYKEGMSPYDRPSFCIHCGSPFPWTVAKLNAAKELADEIEGLSEDDRQKLKSAFDDISSEGPRSQVGAARLKRMLGNATTAIGKAAWKIGIEIATETAKKALLG